MAAVEVESGQITDGSQVDLGEVPLELLEREIEGLAANLAAATAQWILWIGAYDRREGYKTWGLVSTAHWLNLRCGLSLTAGRERVRVARALEELPKIQEAFLAGELSYSKVRALTRAANVDCEESLLTMARNATASQVDRICAGVRRSRDAADPKVAEDAWLRRSLSSSDNHDGTFSFRTVAGLEDTEAMTQQIDKAVTVLISRMSEPGRTRREIIEHCGGIAALRHDAMVALITGTIDAASLTAPEVVVMADADAIKAAVENTDASQTNSGPDVPAGTSDHDRSAGSGDAPTVDNPQSCDAESGTGGIGTSDSSESKSSSAEICGSDVPAGTSGSDRYAEFGAPPTASIAGSVIDNSVLRRILCDCKVSMQSLTDGDPNPIGKMARTPNRALRRALERRDNGCCQFPGCAATKRLHAHHIVFWENDGPTELDNLVLVCDFHHHLVHEGRWTIRKTPNETMFVGPDGQTATVGRSRGNATTITDDPNTDRPITLAPLVADRLEDLPWVTTMVLHNEALHRQRRQDNLTLAA